MAPSPSRCTNYVGKARRAKPCGKAMLLVSKPLCVHGQATVQQIVVMCPRCDGLEG